jgi:hypothetical protein
MDLISRPKKSNRGRPLGSTKRYKLGDSNIPEFVGYCVVMDLLRQLLNWCPRYNDWREVVESGAIPSYPHPGGLKVWEVRVRLYKWPEVEAYYRSILQPIAPRKIS